ncbi:MAG TPA: FAD-binding oxidoreductase [Marmoricola sp.]|nr:FAD-binding oxidoreductase [Marmoricola sp.]
MSIETPDAPVASTDAARRLKDECGDVVVLPGEPDYDAVRMPWNVAAQQRPAAVAVPTSAEEVQRVVRAAVAAGLRIAPQGTGHGAAALAGRDLGGALLLRTTAMTAVTVDAERRVARVEAGVVAEQVVDAAAAHGLACLHGSSPDVGVAGLVLGGGIGWYSRTHGLACNRVEAVELVTADGELVRADAAHHADLFWALRGGGGNFGVVTAIELRLLPIADAYAGVMMWDIADFEAVLRHFNEWAPTAPDEVSTSLRAMRFPPLPFIPEEVRGKSLVLFDGAVLADDARGEEIVAGFRELGPFMDTWQRVPAPSLIRLHQDPEGPTPAVGNGLLLDKLEEADLQSFVAAVGPDSETSLLMVELRQLGGALRREAPGSGALATLDADFGAYFVGIAPTPEIAAVGEADTERAMAAVAGAAAAQRYLNFVEKPVDTSVGFAEGAWQRLQAVRAAVDPQGVFLANHAFGS